MKTLIVIALTALCAASSLARAALPDPADASVAVPAPHYVSPLTGYSVAPDSTSPDKNWRAANEAAAQQDSMAGMDMSDPDAHKATKP